MKNIVIIGAGGIGRETAWIIEAINKLNLTWNIVGFIDDNNEMWDKELNGYRVLGSIDYLKSMDNKPYVVVAMANPKVKKNIVERLGNEFDFATIIDPSVRISQYIEIGYGSIVYPGVILTVNTTIKEHVIISSNCGIGHDTIIEKFSSVLWGTKMSGYDSIGEECLIGVGCKIAQGIKIGDKNNIVAGTVILEDIT